MAPKGSKANLDQILEKYVGGIGRYQVFITIILYHLNLSGHFYHVYTAYAPDHRCKVPSCEAQNQNKVHNVQSSNIMNYINTNRQGTEYNCLCILFTDG